MGKTSTVDRSAAAIKANATRRANEREREVMAVVDQLRSMQTFVSPQKEYARTQVALFLAPYGGPVADMQGPGGGSARVLTAAGLDVISAEDGRSALFAGIRRDLLRAALERMADGWRFYFGDLTDILPDCQSAFLDACGPLYVDSPSADLVRAAVAARLEAFALTVMLARVEGVKGAAAKADDRRADRSAGYYVSLARAVLAEDAPMYRIRRVLRYPGEANVPFAVFMLERHVCRVEGCERRVFARGFCQRDYDRLPERVEARRAYLEAHPEYLAEWRRKRLEYQRRYYPNWVMNPDVRADWLEYHREYSRAHHAKPENRARARELTRIRRADPEYRARERARDEATRKARLAAVSGTAAKAVKID